MNNQVSAFLSAHNFVNHVDVLSVAQAIVYDMKKGLKKEGADQVKKILVAITAGERERARFQSIAEACGADCEITYTTAEEATEQQIAEAGLIIGNVPPKSIRASENLVFVRIFIREDLPKEVIRVIIATASIWPLRQDVLRKPLWPSSR